MKKSEIQGFSVSDKTVAVIGCGGLGCNIAVHLAGEGVGKIYLCDFDKVSESNLNRQFLYTKSELGEYKAQAAAKRLSEYAGEVCFVPVIAKTEKESDMEFAKECDVIFLAVDNNAARKTVSSFCTKHKIALVNGGIDGSFGSAYLYVPGRTPCPDCAGIFHRESGNILSVSTAAGIIGALEAHLGTEYLLSPDTESAGKLYIYDNFVIAALAVKKSKECKICNNTKE